MTDVCSLRAWPSTAFQTLATQGHVVSTIWTPRSDSSFISCTEAPKAGRITTSLGCTPEKSFPFPFTSWMMEMSISWRRRLTAGLWMISLVTCILAPGHWRRAS